MSKPNQSVIILRVPRPRKAAYVRAARPARCFAVLDKAANYTPEGGEK